MNHLNLWPEADIETLRALHAQDLSAGKIAALMPGKTRNAIIGKLNRLKLALSPRTRNGSPPATVRATKGSASV